MVEESYIIKVIFRKFKDGEILALFPEEKELSGNCSCYQHIGQHGIANYDHCINITSPASPEEYADLKVELENIGYDLNIKRKWIRK